LNYATTFIFDEPSSADIESERAEAFAASGLMAVFTIGFTAVRLLTFRGESAHGLESV